MDARMPARVPSYKLTLWAFGSGELKTYVCFRFPDPTYIFGPILNILLC